MTVHRHLLRVDQGVDAFADLLATAQAAGVRVGWLELETPAAVPPSLEAAAGLGALRAVTVGGGRSVAVKPMRGAPVLGDVLREHFRGCSLVLVQGEVDAAWLRPAQSGWSIGSSDGASREWSTEEVVRHLAKPRPPWQGP